MDKYSNLDFYVNGNLMTEDGKLLFICDFNNATKTMVNDNCYEFYMYPNKYIVYLHQNSVNVIIL